MLNKTSQKRVSKVNEFLLKTFKTTTDLNQSLKKCRKHTENKYLETGKRALELLSAHLSEIKPDKTSFDKEKEYFIQTEVKNLDQFFQAPPNEKLASLIREQKDRRRANHFRLWNEYEKLIDSLFKSLEQTYEEIRGDVKAFFDQSDAGIYRYFNSYTNEVLLELDITVIDELRKYIMDNKIAREERIQNLLERLNDVELERESTLQQMIEQITTSLIENAYLLEPEVRELAKRDIENYKIICQNKRLANQKYVEEINSLQKTTFETFEKMALDAEKRWRRLHHDRALLLFQEELKKRKYTNPEERNLLYQKLQEDQLSIFNKRHNYLQELDTITPDSLQKAIIERILDNIKLLNEEAQKIYDQRFEELKQQQIDIEDQLKTLRESLKLEMLSYNADLEEGQTFDSIIMLEVQPVINQILENNRNILLEAMRSIEENDLRANELLINLSNFYIILGGIHDEQGRKLKQFKFDYELKKAKIADDNDETLDKLQDELELEKKNIRQAVHHLKLEEFLKAGFMKLDEIENEYRVFHEKNVKLIQTHPDLIHSFFITCEKEIANKFELIDSDKQTDIRYFQLNRRGEIEEKYRKEVEKRINEILTKEEQEREEQEKRALDDKNKKGPKTQKKDPKKVQKDLEDRKAQLLSQIEPRKVQEYLSPQNIKWCHKFTIEEFVKEFFCIKEEDDDIVKQIEIKQELVSPKTNLAINIPISPSNQKKEDSKETKDKEKSTSRQKPIQDKKSPKGKKEEVNLRISRLNKQETKPIVEEEIKEPAKEKEYFINWVIESPKDLDGNNLLRVKVIIKF